MNIHAALANAASTPPNSGRSQGAAVAVRWPATYRTLPLLSPATGPGPTPERTPAPAAPAGEPARPGATGALPYAFKPVVTDRANHRLLVAATQPNGPAIYAVDLVTGAACLFLAQPAIAGGPSVRLTGLALDRTNDCLYYMLHDAHSPSPANHLRRVQLDGTGDAPVRTTAAGGPAPPDLAGTYRLLATARARGAEPVAPLPGAAQGLAGISVATALAGAITGTSAVLGGYVAGAAAGAKRGVVYSSFVDNPTLGNGTRIEIGSGSGSFSQSVSLSNDTAYYVRAYASSAGGTVYGSAVVFRTLAPLSATIALRHNAEPRGTSATVAVAGGSAPYAHSWRNTSNSITLAQAGATVLGLAPGNYTVTVTDSTGATTTASVIIL